MLYSERDMDSLHVLPLAVMPLQTGGLQGASLVKNSKLSSVIELFSGEQTGSGQIEISDLGLQFEALQDRRHPDVSLLSKLGQLRSYDVYSLRITLREERIPIKNQEFLRLSQTKQAELAQFMQRFTQSLLQKTFAPTPVHDDNEFGLELVEINQNDAAGDLSALINPSDPGIVYAKLEDLSQRLEIRLDDLPKFLEDFADINLSIAYYDNCFDQVMKDFDEFTAVVSRLIGSNETFRRNQELIQKCDQIDYAMSSAKTFIQEQLMLFDIQTRDFWKDVTADRFRDIEKMAKANHTKLGGILCGITVKMNSWRTKFPAPKKASPTRVAEFVMSELGEGIGNIFDAA